MNIIMSALILRAVSVTLESLDDVDDVMLDSGDKIGAVSVKYTVSSSPRTLPSQLSYNNDKMHMLHFGSNYICTNSNRS